MLVSAYATVALSALQVLLATDQGRDNTNEVPRGVSLSIGTASIVSVGVAVPVMAALFAVLRFVNEAFAKRKRVDVANGFPL